MNGVPDDLAPFMSRMVPVIDDAIKRLKETKFRLDPIGGRKYSRATSIISSAYKRHGNILGRAVLERLRDSAQFRVWSEDEFKLSTESLEEIRSGYPEARYITKHLPYGDIEKVVPVDLLVFHHSTKALTAYNIKRGNGAYDAGKKRQIYQELLRTRMLLHGYASANGIKTSTVEARVVFYYGLKSLPHPWSLDRDELDDQFELPVKDAIEICNHYFQRRLFDLIETEE